MIMLLLLFWPRAIEAPRLGRIVSVGVAGIGGVAFAASQRLFHVQSA